MPVCHHKQLTRRQQPAMRCLDKAHAKAGFGLAPGMKRRVHHHHIPWFQGLIGQRISPDKLRAWINHVFACAVQGHRFCLDQIKALHRGMRQDRTAQIAPARAQIGDPRWHLGGQSLHEQHRTAIRPISRKYPRQGAKSVNFTGHSRPSRQLRPRGDNCQLSMRFRQSLAHL